MMVKCPNCKEEYGVNPSQYTQSILPVNCKACNAQFKIIFNSNKRIICPNCSLDQPNSKECNRCGVIFEKFKAINKNPTHKNRNKVSIQDSREGKLFNWKRAWLVCSILYFIIVLIDCMIVYPNEYNRPKRDKYNATIDLILYSDFLEEIEYTKRVLEDMVDRRVRKSHIYDFFEDRCYGTGKFVSIKKSNRRIKAKFMDGTILVYNDINSTVLLRKKQIPNDNQFNFFPSIRQLHTKYKDIDLDEMIWELETKFDYLDFSSIEKKYQKRMQWLELRFVLFGFLFFIIPVCIGYILAGIIDWYQRFDYNNY